MCFDVKITHICARNIEKLTESQFLVSTIFLVKTKTDTEFEKLPLLGHGSGAYAGIMLVDWERPTYKSYKHDLVQSCNVRRPYASASSALIEKENR